MNPFVFAANAGMAVAVASGLPMSHLLHSRANLQGSCHFNGVELIA
jgi:hypothetical protein